MYDYVIPEHEKFSNTVQNDSAAAANNQTKEVTKLKKNVSKLQITIHRNISSLSMMIDHYHK